MSDKGKGAKGCTFVLSKEKKSQAGEGKKNKKSRLGA